LSFCQKKIIVFELTRFFRPNCARNIFHILIFRLNWINVDNSGIMWCRRRKRTNRPIVTKDAPLLKMQRKINKYSESTNTNTKCNVTKQIKSNHNNNLKKPKENGFLFYSLHTRSPPFINVRVFLFNIALSFTRSIIFINKEEEKTLTFGLNNRLLFCWWIKFLLNRIGF
jgi:hypothetical protein